MEPNKLLIEKLKKAYEGTELVFYTGPTIIIDSPLNKKEALRYNLPGEVSQVIKTNGERTEYTPSKEEYYWCARIYIKNHPSESYRHFYAWAGVIEEYEEENKTGGNA